MEFEVYCDESMPDLFTTTKSAAQYLMIGSLWSPANLREEIKGKITELREKHGVWGEIKWRKVSPSRLSFYLDLIDLFHGYGQELRFRCIAVDRMQIDKNWFDHDNELGFYKFYYQVLHHWILDFNSYRIFCDTKSNRDPDRLMVLKQCLTKSNLSSQIESIQSLPSKQVVMMQLCDLLLGSINSRINRTLSPGSAKEELAKRLENHLGVDRLQPTVKGAEKFNIFKIRLQGGW
mgnify:CR=1 FL=1